MISKHSEKYAHLKILSFWYFL